jgi:hypothetical protein
MEQRNSTTERSNKKPVEGDRPRPSRRLAAHESGGRADTVIQGKQEVHAASATD